MKKQDILYAMLSVMLLVLSAYLYITYGNTHVVTPKPTPKQVAKPTTQVSPKEDDLTKLTKQLDNLEKEPNGDALAALKPELDKLKASTQKDALLSRFDKLNAEVARITEAETALQATADNPSQANLAYTQELIDKVQTVGRKQALQDRLNTLANSATATESPTPNAPTVNTGSATTPAPEAPRSANVSAPAAEQPSPATPPAETPAPEPTPPAEPAEPTAAEPDGE